MSSPVDLWNICSSSLRNQISDAAWRTWFQDLVPIELTDDALVLAAPSAVVKERVEGRFLPLVHDALVESGRGPTQIVIEVRAPAGPDTHVSPASAPARPPLRDSDVGTDPSDRFELNADYNFDTFVIGSSNRFAHAAAQSAAELPARAFNPLFIYGAAGLGKTHLLHAIGHYTRENYSELRVKYVSTEVFTNEFIDAIRTNTQTVFKRRYRRIDVLLIDDIQFLENKEGTQEEFFHTFNALHSSNKQIVISSDRPPDAIATLEDRLRSRFKWGLITDIQPPDLETRLAILRKKAEREPQPVPHPVLEFIGTHITNNIRELEGALIRLFAYASLTQEPLSVDLAQRALSDLLASGKPRQITPRLILDATAEMFGFSVEELTGESRRRPLVTARQIAMYVFREATDLSYPAIAREFGGRDHTTIIYAVEKIGNLMKERREIYDKVTELIQRMKGV